MEPICVVGSTCRTIFVSVRALPLCANAPSYCMDKKRERRGQSNVASQPVPRTARPAQPTFDSSDGCHEPSMSYHLPTSGCAAYLAQQQTTQSHKVLLLYSFRCLSSFSPLPFSVRDGQPVHALQPMLHIHAALFHTYISATFRA